MGVLFCAIYEINIDTWKIDGWKTFFHGFVLVFNQFHQDLAQQILMKSEFGESFHVITTTWAPGHEASTAISDFTATTICALRLATQELLDRPYINKRTGLDFVVMCVMGFILGLLSIPYCCLIDPAAGFVDVVMLCGLDTLWLRVVGMFNGFFLGGSIFLAAGSQGSPIRTEQIRNDTLINHPFQRS